jgi:hypothetical protein
MGVFRKDELEALEAADEDVYKSLQTVVADRLDRYLEDAHQGVSFDALPIGSHRA